MQYSNLIGQKIEDIQISFSPSMQHCNTEAYQICEGKEIKAVFQLWVKPGSYSVTREDVEWTTKETGAIVLNALLLKIT